MNKVEHAITRGFRRNFKEGDLVRLKGTEEVKILEEDEDFRGKVFWGYETEWDTITEDIKHSYRELELLLPVEKVKELKPFGSNC